MKSFLKILMPLGAFCATAFQSVDAQTASYSIDLQRLEKEAVGIFPQKLPGDTTMVVPYRTVLEKDLQKNIGLYFPLPDERMAQSGLQRHFSANLADEKPTITIRNLKPDMLQDFYLEEVYEYNKETETFEPKNLHFYYFDRKYKNEDEDNKHNLDLVVKFYEEEVEIPEKRRKNKQPQFRNVAQEITLKQIITAFGQRVEPYYHFNENVEDLYTEALNIMVSVINDPNAAMQAQRVQHLRPIKNGAVNLLSNQ